MAKRNVHSISSFSKVYQKSGAEQSPDTILGPIATILIYFGNGWQSNAEKKIAWGRDRDLFCDGEWFYVTRNLT